MARSKHYRPAGLHLNFPCKSFRAEMKTYRETGKLRPLGTTDVRQVTCLDCLAVISHIAYRRWSDLGGDAQ